MNKLSALLFVSLSLAACGKKESLNEFTGARVTVKEAPPLHEVNEIMPVNANKESVKLGPPPPPPVAEPVQDKAVNEVSAQAPIRQETKISAQIIKNAVISYQVENMDSSHSHIAMMLSGCHAYFGSDRRRQDGNTIVQTMVIRVPSADFDRLTEVLMTESIYTRDKDITTEDVTAEYVDIQARLKSKKEIEKQYIELLSRAQKVSEVLEVDNNLRVIREEIESTEGRLKLLRDQVSYSTINLTAEQKLKGSQMPEMRFAPRLIKACIKGWHRLLTALLYAVAAWPLMLLVLPLLYWIMRKRAR